MSINYTLSSQPCAAIRFARDSVEPISILVDARGITYFPQSERGYIRTTVAASYDRIEWDHILLSSVDLDFAASENSSHRVAVLFDRTSAHDIRHGRLSGTAVILHHFILSRS